MEALKILQKQRDFFLDGKTRSLSERKTQLQSLRALVEENEDKLLEALHQDLGKPEVEAYVSEVGFLLPEIKHTLKHLEEWASEKPVSTPLMFFPSTSSIIYEPKGVVLIISPWNYPVQLLLAPLIPALAAGNTAVLKPSEFTPATAAVIEELVAKYFESEWVTVVQGEGHKVVPQMIENFRFDHLFFTGSPKVGSILAQQAAKYLIPTTLELGGKSPTIIDESANLKLAAKQVALGKMINAGQTCIAPDYVLAHASVAEQFASELKKEVERVLSLEENHYAKLIHNKHFEQQEKWLADTEILWGGKRDKDKRFFEPTLVKPKENSSLMKEEIFGPILPLFTFQSLEEARRIILENPHPLALYLFTKRKSTEEFFLERVQFGGGAKNNTLIHIANPELPFGGIMNSGQGKYHGKDGFETFSNKKSWTRSSANFELPVKFPPYNSFKKNVLRFFFRYF